MLLVLLHIVSQTSQNTTCISQPRGPEDETFRGCILIKSYGIIFLGFPEEERVSTDYFTVTNLGIGNR